MQRLIMVICPGRGISTDEQFTKEKATENRHEVANVKCHDRKHAV